MNVANRERVKEVCVIYSCMMNSACRWMHYMYRGRERKWLWETTVSQDDGLWGTECGGQDEGKGCLFSFELPSSFSLPLFLFLSTLLSFPPLAEEGQEKRFRWARYAAICPVSYLPLLSWELTVRHTHTHTDGVSVTRGWERGGVPDKGLVEQPHCSEASLRTR